MVAVGLLCAATFGANAAEVVQRGTVSARPTVSRASNAASRMPTIQAVAAQQQEAVQPAAPASAEIVEAVEVADAAPLIENKSSQFDKVLDKNSSGASDMSADALAEAIRAQRNALDSSDASATAARQMEAAMAGNSHGCDSALRECMTRDCGNDFAKCAGDGDTIFGDKLERCRRNATCTSQEFQAFSREIKADRDHGAKMSSYTDVLNCGNRYNSCIFEKCLQRLDNGQATLDGCVGKAAGDKAVADCRNIANDCKAIDSGLASRATQVFGTLRQGAEVQAKKDEERLYELRRLMSSQCQALGAMFDERSLECVFTVSFFAGEESTLFASKKLYAGGTFDCTPNWFGIDVTTFMENAYRLTRSQTAASSAMLGSGAGQLLGAVSSGAINRAIDRQKADNALGQAECEAAGGKHKSVLGIKSCDCGDGKKYDKDSKACVDKDSKGSEEKKTVTETPTQAGGSGGGSGGVGGGGQSGSPDTKPEIIDNNPKPIETQELKDARGNYLNILNDTTTTYNQICISDLKDAQECTNLNTEITEAAKLLGE
jgi:hypothetical protein